MIRVATSELSAISKEETLAAMEERAQGYETKAERLMSHGNVKAALEAEQTAELIRAAMKKVQS